MLHKKIPSFYSSVRRELIASVGEIIAGEKIIYVGLIKNPTARKTTAAFKVCVLFNDYE